MPFSGREFFAKLRDLCTPEQNRQKADSRKDPTEITGSCNIRIDRMFTDDQTRDDQVAGDSETFAQPSELNLSPAEIAQLDRLSLLLEDFYQVSACTTLHHLAIAWIIDQHFHEILQLKAQFPAFVTWLQEHRVSIPQIHILDKIWRQHTTNLNNYFKIPGIFSSQHSYLRQQLWARQARMLAQDYQAITHLPESSQKRLFLFESHREMIESLRIAQHLYQLNKLQLSEDPLEQDTQQKILKEILEFYPNWILWQFLVYPFVAIKQTMILESIALFHVAITEHLPISAAERTELLGDYQLLVTELQKRLGAIAERSVLLFNQAERLRLIAELTPAFKKFTQSCTQIHLHKRIANMLYELIQQLLNPATCDTEFAITRCISHRFAPCEWAYQKNIVSFFSAPLMHQTLTNLSQYQLSSDLFQEIVPDEIQSYASDAKILADLLAQCVTIEWNPNGLVMQPPTTEEHSCATTPKYPPPVATMPAVASPADEWRAVTITEQSSSPEEYFTNSKIFFDIFYILLKVKNHILSAAEPARTLQTVSTVEQQYYEKLLAEQVRNLQQLAEQSCILPQQMMELIQTGLIWVQKYRDANHITQQALHQQLHHMVDTALNGGLSWFWAGLYAFAITKIYKKVQKHMVKVADKSNDSVEGQIEETIVQLKLQAKSKPLIQKTFSDLFTPPASADSETLEIANLLTQYHASRSDNVSQALHMLTPHSIFKYGIKIVASSDELGNWKVDQFFQI